MAEEKEGTPKKVATKKPKADGDTKSASAKASKTKAVVALDPNYRPRLKTKFINEIAPKVMEEYKLKSIMSVPRLQKIVLNMGVGEALANKKVLDSAVSDLELISGQHPVKVKARVSISTFKLREGNEIGTRVTLRGPRMWEFLDRLLSVALPRVRDFRGVSPKSFDGRGNYNLGIKEQIIFPEIKYDKVDQIRGLDIALVLSGESDELSRAVLTALGMPFRK